jgi:A118 family predicted phage portal protein
MNSQIINWLNSRYGYSLTNDYYDKISVWEDWWKGFHEPFHRIVFENGEKKRSRDMYTMKMAKKVCEDWASILINDKTFVKLNDEYSQNFLVGDSENGGVFGSNCFWEQANDLMEKMMYSGTAAIVIRLKNALFSNDGKLMPSPDMRIDLNYLEADKIIPLSVVNGEITEAAFCTDMCIHGQNRMYLEIHRLENGKYVIENHIFKVDRSEKNLIIEEKLPPNLPTIIRTNCNRPWFSICKPAIVNPIKSNHGMGCAVFANAIDNLKGVDLAFNNFNSDFWLGQKKVFLNRNMLADMAGSKKIAPDEVNQQLFYYIGETMDDGTGKSMVQEHNPDLRVADNTAGIQAQLDYLSFKVGFGTKHYQFNNGSIVTATQYTGDKQDLIQNAHKHFIKVESFLHRLVKTLLWVGHNFIDSNIRQDAHISVVFDQSPLVDENAERQRDKDDVSAGLMLAWEYRVKWYGETEANAKKILSEIPTDDELMDFDVEDGEE